MRTRFILVGIGLLCLLLSPWAKADLFNDGGVHDIISGSYDRIDVDKEPPPAPDLPAFTTVNFGGTADASTLEAFKNSRVTINAGFITFGWGASAYNNSQLTMNGGYVVHGLHAHDNSQLTMNGGRVENGIWAYNDSRVTMNDGLNDGMVAYDDSHVTINGGNPGGFYTYDNSHVTINAGSAGASLLAYDNSQATMNGGQIDGCLGASDDSQITMNAGEAQSLFADGNGRVTMNDGSVVDVYADGNGRVTMNDGSVLGVYATGNGQVIVRGGGIWLELNALDQALVTIVGSGFAVYKGYEQTDLIFSGYGNLTSFFDGCFLWGTLPNGGYLEDVQLRISGDGQVSLVPLPGAALLGIIGLSYAGLRLRRRAC